MLFKCKKTYIVIDDFLAIRNSLQSNDFLRCVSIYSAIFIVNEGVFDASTTIAISIGIAIGC